MTAMMYFHATIILIHNKTYDFDSWVSSLCRNLENIQISSSCSMLSQQRMTRTSTSSSSPWVRLSTAAARQTQPLLGGLSYLCYHFDSVCSWYYWYLLMSIYYWCITETDLHAVIKKGNLLKDIHKCYILYQLLKATKFIHSGNVIHRDQKVHSSHGLCSSLQFSFEH